MIATLKNRSFAKRFYLNYKELKLGIRQPA